MIEGFLAMPTPFDALVELLTGGGRKQ